MKITSLKSLSRPTLLISFSLSLSMLFFSGCSQTPNRLLSNNVITPVALFCTANGPTTQVTNGVPFNVSFMIRGGVAPFSLIPVNAPGLNFQSGLSQFFNVQQTLPSNLSAGPSTFSAQAIDASGAIANCSWTVNQQSTVQNPLACNFTLSNSNPSVGETVTITANATGGLSTSPYTFSNFSYGESGNVNLSTFGNTATASVNYVSGGAKAISVMVSNNNISSVCSTNLNVNPPQLTLSSNLNSPSSYTVTATLNRALSLPSGATYQYQFISSDPAVRISTPVGSALSTAATVTVADGQSHQPTITVNIITNGGTVIVSANTQISFAAATSPSCQITAPPSAPVNAPVTVSLTVGGGQTGSYRVMVSSTLVNASSGVGGVYAAFDPAFQVASGSTYYNLSAGTFSGTTAFPQSGLWTIQASVVDPATQMRTSCQTSIQVSGGVYFFALGQTGTIIAPCTGALRLFMNDQTWGFPDNSGTWNTVFSSYTPGSSVPSSYRYSVDVSRSDGNPGPRLAYGWSYNYSASTNNVKFCQRTTGCSTTAAGRDSTLADTVVPIARIYSLVGILTCE